MDLRGRILTLARAGSLRSIEGCMERRHLACIMDRELPARAIPAIYRVLQVWSV